MIVLTDELLTTATTMQILRSPARDVSDATHFNVESCGDFAHRMPVSDYFLTQLGPGRFEIRATTRSADDVLLARTAVAPLTAGVVVPDPAYIAFILPMRWKGRFLLNGAEVTPLTLGVSGRRNGYRVHGAGRDLIAVGLSRHRFTAALAAQRGVTADEIRLEDDVLQLPPRTMARLRGRLASLLGSGDPRSGSLKSKDEVGCSADEIYELLLGACLDAQLDVAGAPRRRLRRSDIVHRAEQRFVAAAGQPVSAADLCKAAGVGPTALHHAFKDVYGLSPLAYFRKRRLMQAREALVSATPERSAVKRAALSAGLHELGRFSVEYRRLFGERPSATLGRPSA